MQVEMKIIIDLDDDAEKEKMEKINNILLGTEEECCESDSSFKDALVDYEEKLETLKNETKCGSLSYKVFEKAEEAFEESLSDNGVELE